MDTPELPFSDPDILTGITTMRMPFGRYKGAILCDLPVGYLEWFAKKGFPPGKMGMLLSTVYEINSTAWSTCCSRCVGKFKSKCYRPFRIPLPVFQYLYSDKSPCSEII